MASVEQQVNWYLTTTFAGDLVYLCVSAIQVFMWLYMMSFYIEASLETRKRRLPYIIASLVILILQSASSTLEAVQVYTVLFEIAPGPENLETTQGIISQYQERFSALVSLLHDCALRVGEIVLLYRCYLVWFDLRWIILLPMCVLVANIGINLRSYIPLNYDDEKLNTADIFLFVVTNVLLTSLISFRLIRTQRRLAQVMPDTCIKFYLGIVGILVESAAPLAVFGVAISFANLALSFQGTQATLILQPVFSAVAVLAPQLIIFRVTTGTSWADKTDTSAILSQSIQFNGTIQTKTAEENDIQVSEC